jgi:O-antigen/teichoic acid export membrane protein
VAVERVKDAAEALADAEILAKGAGVFLIGVMTARALAIVTQVLMARFLGAAEFGLYAIGWTLIRVLEAFNALGLGTGVIYFGADYQRSNPARFKGMLRQSVAFAFLTGTGIGTSLYFLAPILAQHVFRKPDVVAVIRGFAPAFPFYAAAFVGDGITRLSQKMQYSAYANIGSMSIALTLFCLLFVLGWGLSGALIATVTGIGIGAAISLYFSMSLFPVVFASELRSEWIGREILTFSIPVGLAGLAVSLLAFMDRLFVGSFCSSAETGIYQAASQIPILFAVIFGAFDSIFSPMVADLHARGETPRLAELYRVCTKWRLYVSAPFFLVIFFAPSELIRFVYGRAYSPAAMPLVILSAGQVLGVLAGNSQTLLTLTGRQRLVVKITVATLLVDVALNFVMVERFGLIGAAAASAISAVVLNVSTAAAVIRHTGISPFDMRYGKSLAAVCLASFALCMLRFLRFATPAVALFGVSTVGLTVFVGCLVALGLDAEDCEVLEIIRARFGSPLRAGSRQV